MESSGSRSSTTERMVCVCALCSTEEESIYGGVLRGAAQPCIRTSNPNRLTYPVRWWLGKFGMEVDLGV